MDRYFCKSLESILTWPLHSKNSEIKKKKNPSLTKHFNTETEDNESDCEKSPLQDVLYLEFMWAALGPFFPTSPGQRPRSHHLRALPPKSASILSWGMNFSGWAPASRLLNLLLAPWHRLTPLKCLRAQVSPFSDALQGFQVPESGDPGVWDGLQGSVGSRSLHTPPMSPVPTSPCFLCYHTDLCYPRPCLGNIALAIPYARKCLFSVRASPTTLLKMTSLPSLDLLSPTPWLFSWFITIALSV